MEEKVYFEQDFQFFYFCPKRETLRNINLSTFLRNLVMIERLF
ncbi:hypothetical protein SR187_3080 [Streptococcus ruminantium]|uniref:Uncharacterized protein n=1 Tax=Streptococcus ruminantium TaxID=1917441 RepID=A0A2Z5TP91_9STRE|nr:hypothetical protein SR187_3080 [Streptococcus ruminantium]